MRHRSHPPIAHPEFLHVDILEGHIFPAMAGCDDCHGLPPATWDQLTTQEKDFFFRATCFKTGSNGVPKPCFFIEHHASQCRSFNPANAGAHNA